MREVRSEAVAAAVGAAAPASAASAAGEAAAPASAGRRSVAVLIALNELSAAVFEFHGFGNGSRQLIKRYKHRNAS